MIATRILKAPLTPLSQGYVPFNASSAAATLAVGPLSPGQSVSLPFGSSPLQVLHLSIPTNETPDEQYQHMIETAQWLQGMALSVCPSFIPAGPEVPVLPHIMHFLLHFRLHHRLSYSRFQR